MNCKKNILAILSIVMLFASFTASAAIDDEIFQNVKKPYKYTTPKGYGESPEHPSNQQAVSRKELVGTITNEYGIRDDILRFIETELPESNAQNIQAKRAAIKLAAYKQRIYYELNPQDALKEASKELIALNCLGLALPKESNEWLKISRGISKLMNNTKARASYRDFIDKNYFAFRIWGADISSDEHRNNCKRGNY